MDTQRTKGEKITANKARHPNKELARYRVAYEQAVTQFQHLELMKQRASQTKYKTLENLDKHLLDFESSFNKSNGKILWAPTAENALTELKALFQKNSDKKIYFQQSLLAKECGLSKELKNNPQATRLDNNTFPEDFRHWTFPYWNKERPAVTNSGTPVIDTNSIAILPAEFFVCETGAIVTACSTSGTQQMLANSRIQVFLAGIEQVLPVLSDLDTLLPLLSTFRNGEKNNNLYTITNGPKQQKEADGPAEVYLVLIDNGRTDLLAKIPQREALHCINCGACLSNSNLSVLNKDFGEGNFYGPIGAVKAPHMAGFEKYIEWSFDLPLSGRASSYCPVNIDLRDLLLENRRECIDKGASSRMDGYAWVVWKKTMMSRKWLNKGAGMKNFTLKGFFKKGWGEARDFPKATEKSFNERWSETRGNPS